MTTKLRSSLSPLKSTRLNSSSQRYILRSRAAEWLGAKCAGGKRVANSRIGKFAHFSKSAPDRSTFRFRYRSLPACRNSSVVASHQMCGLKCKTDLFAIKTKRLDLLFKRLPISPYQQAQWLSFCDEFFEPAGGTLPSPSRSRVCYRSCRAPVTSAIADDFLPSGSHVAGGPRDDSSCASLRSSAIPAFGHYDIKGKTRKGFAQSASPARCDRFAKNFVVCRLAAA